MTFSGIPEANILVATVALRLVCVTSVQSSKLGQTWHHPLKFCTMAFLGHLVLLEEAAGRKPLCLMVTLITMVTLATRSSGMIQQVLTTMETGSEGGSRKYCTLEVPMP